MYRYTSNNGGRIACCVPVFIFIPVFSEQKKIELLRVKFKLETFSHEYRIPHCYFEPEHTALLSSSLFVFEDLPHPSE